MNQNPQNGKNSFSPKTQAVIQRIQALIRERQAATNAEAPEASEAPERPDNPPPGVAPVVDTGLTTPPASRPSGRATGPLRLKDLIPDVAITKATPPPAPMREVPTLTLVRQALERHPEAVEGLSHRARTLYEVMVATGIIVLKRMGRPITKSLSQVLVFAPNDALVAALGIPERTLYRALQELKDAGLLTGRRIHAPAVINGRPGLYAAGTLYAVRLPHRDRRPRLEAEDLRHPWRDLQGDIEAGATAWADLMAWYGGKGKVGEVAKKRRQEAKTHGLAESSILPLKEESEVLEYLVRWTLSPGQRRTGPLDLDSANGGLTGLLARLGRAKPQARRRLVEEIALGLAKEFRDPGSVPFYAWTLWNAFRAEVYGYAPGAMKVVLWAIERVRMAVRSGGVRRPGALLATFLAEQGLLDLFRQAPQWRVA